MGPVLVVPMDDQADLPREQRFVLGAVISRIVSLSVLW